MTTEVEICNVALSNIRAGSINSLEENTLQSQTCKLKYPLIRDMLLNELAWGFAHKIKGLSLLTTEIFNWTIAYQYPADCLKINRLVGAQEALANADADVVSRLAETQLMTLNDMRINIPYEIFNFTDNRIIATNESDLYIDYIARITDPNLFSTNFTMSLSHLLAAELCISLIGAETGRQLRSDSLQMYKEYIATAEADDLNEQYFTPNLSELETIRR